MVESFCPRLKAARAVPSCGVMRGSYNRPPLGPLLDKHRRFHEVGSSEATLIPRFNFPSRKRFEREPNYLEDTSLVMALGHGLLLLDGGPVIRHLARWSEPKSLKRPNQLHCRNCRHEFKRSRQLGK